MKIEKSNAKNLNDNEFVCFEYRYGNDYKTTEHFVFRNHKFNKQYL